MDDNSIKEYIDGRFAKALVYYDKRAGMYKQWYRRLSVYVIAASAALTAFVALVPPEVGWRIASTVLSASIVVATGLIAHYKCHENWLSYRASWDALTREQEFHNARIHEYDSAGDPNALFVQRVEAILTKEAADFYARHLKRDEASESAANKP